MIGSPGCSPDPGIVLWCIYVYEESLSPGELPESVEGNQAGPHPIKQPAHFALATRYELGHILENVSRVDRAQWFQLTIRIEGGHSLVSFNSTEQEIQKLCGDEGEIASDKQDPWGRTRRKGDSDRFEWADPRILISEHLQPQTSILGAVGDDRNAGGDLKHCFDDALNHRPAIDFEPGLVPAHSGTAAARRHEAMNIHSNVDCRVSLVPCRFFAGQPPWGSVFQSIAAGVLSTLRSLGESGRTGIVQRVPEFIESAR